MQECFGRADSACLCWYRWSRHLWFCDRGGLWRVNIATRKMALSWAKRFPRPKKTPALHANRSIYCYVPPPLWLIGFDDLPVWYIPRLPWTLPFVKSEISLRKHPFLLALRRWDVSRVSPRETSPAAKSEEKRMFSQAKSEWQLNVLNLVPWKWRL